MNIKAQYLLFAVFCLFIAKSSHGQTGAPIVWRKTVARTIELNKPEDEKIHRLKDIDPQKSLLVFIINELKDAKLTAYSSDDYMFSTKLSQTEISVLVDGKLDTMDVIDRNTRESRKLVRVININYTDIYKYRILEEWKFYPETSKTEVQIIGIAPVEDAYDYLGASQGVKIMFWLKYNDVITAINKYEQYNPDNTITGKIWHDYFLSDNKPAIAK